MRAVRRHAAAGGRLCGFSGTGDGVVVAGQRVEIRAGRVALREVLPDEAGRLVDGGPRDRSWADGYPLPGTLPPARALIAQDHDGQWRPGFGMYQVVLPATNGAEEATVIGDVGFHTAPSVGSVEIGYGIVPSHRGHGYVTEAVKRADRVGAGAARGDGSARRDRSGQRRVPERPRPRRIHAGRRDGGGAPISPGRCCLAEVGR